MPHRVGNRPAVKRTGGVTNLSNRNGKAAHSVASGTKNKKGLYHLITAELSERLSARIRNKLPHEKAFSHDKYSLLSSFKRDGKAAGIERRRADGRSVDVHCLRRTFGTMPARAGVPLTTVQKLMRHSTPELTAKRYIDVEEIDLQEAVAKLPGF